MKTYTKPTLEINSFRINENIATNPTNSYNDDNGVPVDLFDINEALWNSPTS